MIFTYDKTNKQIKSLSETDFKTQKILERQDIEKWVECYPELLGEDLFIITTEFDKFDKTNERLDLLALDKEGNLSVIELKRDSSGKNVELQALKYAAYCSTLTFDDIVNMNVTYQKSKGIIKNKEEIRTEMLMFIGNDDFEELTDKPRIILVAKEFTPEVTASVLWLRKFSIDISCIKFRPYEMNNNIIVFESSIIIPLPEAKDYLIQVDKKENIENNKTITNSEYYNFFSSIREMLFKEIKDISLPEAKLHAYYQIPTYISGIHFEFAFHGRPRNSFGIELHFEKSNKLINHELIKMFAPYKEQLELGTEEVVNYQETWGTNWSRIFILRNTGQMTDELKKWGIEKMKKMIEILRPEIYKIKGKGI